MKKTLLGYLAILVGIFIILSLMDKNGDYMAEQIIWKTNKQLSESAKNSNAIPDQVFEKIIRQYEKVIYKFPNAQITPVAYLYLGRAYIVRKDYETARQKMEVVFQETSPAIDKAQILPDVPPFDYNDYNRETEWDIGALEFKSQGTKLKKPFQWSLNP